MTYTPTHAELVERAAAWLKNHGCKAVLKELSTAYATEIPDAIGWRGPCSTLLECKVSRADFLSDKKKIFRHYPHQGMGGYRYYMTPPGLVLAEEMPKGWGLLWVYEKRVMKKKPARFFPQRNKTGETAMLVSALRRIDLSGYLDLIYVPVDKRVLGEGEAA